MRSLDIVLVDGFQYVCYKNTESFKFSHISRTHKSDICVVRLFFLSFRCFTLKLENEIDFPLNSISKVSRKS